MLVKFLNSPEGYVQEKSVSCCESGRKWGVTGADGTMFKEKNRKEGREDGKSEKPGEITPSVGGDSCQQIISWRCESSGLEHLFE